VTKTVALLNIIIAEILIEHQLMYVAAK